MVCVRAAVPDDAPAIALVSVTSWRASYAHILPKSYLQSISVARRATKIRELLDAGSLYWVAEVQGRVVGFASVGPNDEEDVPADAELKALYVLEEFYGSPVGPKLLEAGVTYLAEQGFQALCAFAFLKNERAGKFYVKWGAERYNKGTYSLEGIDYPDQSYLWSSLTDLKERLALAQERDLTV